MVGHEGPEVDNQPGYVYGTGDQFPRVGSPNKFHWRVQMGMVHPYWALFKGNREVGLHLFAIHESIDVPDVLNQMLSGLNHDT